MDLSFHPSPPTVGVEIELALVDKVSLDLTDRVQPLIQPFVGHPDVKPEVFRCAIEVTSPPGRSTSELEAGLLALLADVRRRAGEIGVRLHGGGTHPFSSRYVGVTPEPRFLEAERAGRYLSHTNVTFSTHVHVGMPSAPGCVRALVCLRGAVPALLALSASSPLFHGVDTGFCSFRHRLLAGLRNYGVPPHFDSWEDVESTFTLAERAGIAPTLRDVHWDLRPRPDLGTLELRVLDAQPRVRGSLGLAALVHALLVYALEADQPELGGRLVPPLPWWVEKENGFRASRDGLDAELVVDRGGATRSARDVVVGLFALAAPIAAQLGESEHLRAALDLLEGGTEAERLRARLHRGSRPDEIVAALVQSLDGELDSRRDLGAAPSS